MARHKRRYPFEGPQQQYVQYLEGKVALLANLNAVESTYVVTTVESTSAVNAVESTESTYIVNTVESTSAIETPDIAESETPTPKSPWEEAAADFLDRVPTSESQWSETQRKTQLSTREQIVEAWQILVLRSPFIRSTIPCVRSSVTPFVIVKAYQQLQAVLHQHAANATQLSNYSLLLFYCLCAVARGTGMDVEEVDKLIGACLSSGRQTSAYWMRLRFAAKRAAGLIEELEVNLGPLVSQLFVLCGPPMTTYKKWSDRKETYSYLVGQITTKIKPLTHEEQKDNCISFSPAFLVAYMGPWSLGDVNGALETNLSQEEYERRVRVVKGIEAQVDAQEPARLGRAFVQTGNPDVMLGDHEASQSHCSTTTGQQVARTLLGMRDTQPLNLASPIPTEPPVIPLDYGGIDPSRNQESRGLDTEAFSPVSMSEYLDYQGEQE
ncbi:hypothetical protein MRS44_003791 [Fusarium solani]|uniref:uncharacterized protein n=1 Tax=Fusarium solani TaxID=169388 RepID=UPI0032C3FCAB|nr:hypothetical protein MRS44_003791 [Fusarium solani]